MGLTGIVAERGNISVIGPYEVDNIDINTYGVYTNNLFTGAYRGFGAPQVTLAQEGQMDALANHLGLDRVDVRQRNVLKKGAVTDTGQPFDGSEPVQETLSMGEERSSWSDRVQKVEKFNTLNTLKKRGLGLSFIRYGVCLHAGGQFLDAGGALVQLHKDGSVSVAIGNTEMGQGAFTIAAQCAAEVLGTRLDQVRVQKVDTHTVPDSGPTVASRTTIISGNAVLEAAVQIRKEILPVAAELLEVEEADVVLRLGQAFSKNNPDKTISLGELAFAAFWRNANMQASGWFAFPPKKYDVSTGQGEAYSTYANACHIAEVEVDLLTGEVTVLDMTAVHDVGRAINPEGVVGQVEGGIVQGMGWALMERMQLKEGRLLNPSFTDYLIPSAADAPPISVHLIEEPFKLGPFGAKGIGEPCLIPTPAALLNAVSHAIGIQLTHVPITPEEILTAIVDGEKHPFDYRAEG